MPAFRPLLAAAAAAAAIACPASAQMAGIYTVNPAWPVFPGNFTSLFDAVQALATTGVGGPVIIQVYDDAGPYNETFPITTANVQWAPSTAALAFGQWPGVSSASRVTFTAAAGEYPVIDATGRGMGVFWGGADFVTLDGFEIRNAPFDAISLYSETTHGVVNDAVIQRCRIHDCGGGGVVVYGNSSFPVNTLIQNNFFWRLQQTNAGGFNTTARFGYVTTRRSTNTRVVHNTFVVDTLAGASGCAIGANASGTTEVPYGEVSNNVFVKIAAAGRPLLRIQTPAASTAPVPVICDSNCFFDVTASPLALHGAGGAIVSNSLLDWQTNALRDLASLATDPLLLDLPNRDFHLTAASPCRGTSSVAAGAVDDIDRQPRTAPLDIGADQWSSATITAVGAGCPGTGSLTPVLGSGDWPFLGNATFGMRASQMPPNQAMLVFASFGTAAVPFPIGFGCNVHLQLGSLTTVPLVPVAGPAGTASLVINWPANPAYQGVNFAFQAMVIDSGAPLGITLTNALDIVLGF